MSNTPKPDSPEYEAMMAERFKRQSAGTSVALSEETEHRHIGALSIRRSSTLGPKVATEYFSEEAADGTQITQIEQEIARIESELEAHDGFDQKTGEPRLAYVGNERRLRELKLTQLRRELPYVQETVRRAQEWRAANVPTPEEKLLSEAEHQAAIRQRAQEIADEREAQAQADRVMQERRARRGA
jgi:hypothetical protein